MTAKRIALPAYLAVLCLTCSALAQAAAPVAPPPAPAEPLPPPAPPTFKQPIPSAAYEVELVRIPADKDRKIPSFWISRTEVTWDAFDVFVFGLDGTDSDKKDGPDAVSRPSKPYIPPDRGYGHEGFAAICVSSKSAEEFCKWLSAKSGKKYRLATEDEWEHAARAGAAPIATYSWGDHPALAADFAWTSANSDNAAHAVGTKKPNAFGLHDMHGNAREWVMGRDGQPVVKGGGFRDAPEACTITARWPFEKAWNATDPQIPKSKWWLADGHSIGFRIVCEDTTAAASPATTLKDAATPKKETPK